MPPSENFLTIGLPSGVLVDSVVPSVIAAVAVPEPLTLERDKEDRAETPEPNPEATVPALPVFSYRDPLFHIKSPTSYVFQSNHFCPSFPDTSVQVVSSSPFLDAVDFTVPCQRVIPAEVAYL